MNTRRGFLMAGTAGALMPTLAAAQGPCTAAAEGATAAAAAPVPQRRLGGMPAQAVFQGLQGASFGVAGVGALRLERVHVRPARQHLEQFTVVLSGRPSQALAEGRYELRHPDTGRFELHLTPNGQLAGAPQYRADLSLLV
jgi:hypothetical protein